MNTLIHTPRTIQSIRRWYFGPFCQKSIRMIRMPLSAW